MDDALLPPLLERIRAAHAAGRPLAIRGHGSKAFYGNPVAGEVLDVTGLAGIVDYQPRELTVTARAGTALADLEAALAAHGQMLAFEPPRFGGRGTLGGTLASGLGGPRRAYAGGVRDAVLGVRIVDGRGQPLRFGGQVIKNVAGYDVARLMVGALGTLGLITEATLKVLPRPACEQTRVFACDEAEAIARMNAWAAQPLPLSASAWHAGRLWLRLSGAEAAVRAAAARLGGEACTDGAAFWEGLRDHALPLFAARPLWRLAVASTAPPLGLPGQTLVEAGGGVRWSDADLPAAQLRALARAHGGHATLFRGAPLVDGNFPPRPPAVAALQRRLRAQFDPRAVFNRGRLFPED